MMSMNAWGEESDRGETVSIDAVTLSQQKSTGSMQTRGSARRWPRRQDEVAV